MGFVDVGDVVRIACRQTYTSGGQDVINTIHVRASAQVGVTLPAVQADLGALAELYFDAMRLVISNSLRYTFLELKNVTQDTLLGVIPWPTFVQGANAGQMASPQVVALSVLPSDKSRVMGRVNWGGMLETDVSNGIIDALVLAAMATAQAVMMVSQSMTYGNYQYVIYNRVLGTFRLPVGSKAIIPTRTQRRRSTGFGT